MKYIPYRNDAMMTNTMKNVVLGSVQVVCALAAVTVVLSARAAEPNASSAITELEEVVVTSLKQEQKLLDVPVAVSVVSGDSIKDQSLSTAAELTRVVPGVNVGLPNGPAIPIFSIRGISMSDYNVNQASPVGVYLDEVNLSANYLHGTMLFDIERAEVLRGPQGTLFGQNTTGGAINIVSRRPSFERSGYLNIGVGNYGQKKLQGALESPLGDAWATRLAFIAEQSDGYTTNHFDGADLTDTDRYGLRWSLAYRGKDFDGLLQLNRSYSNPLTPGIASYGTDPGGLDRLSGVCMRVLTCHSINGQSPMTLEIRIRTKLITPR